MFTANASYRGTEDVYRKILFGISPQMLRKEGPIMFTNFPKEENAQATQAAAVFFLSEVNRKKLLHCFLS